MGLGSGVGVISSDSVDSGADYICIYNLVIICRNYTLVTGQTSMTAHDKSPDFVYPLHIIDILDDFAILTVQMASALLRRKVEEQERLKVKAP